MTIAKTLLLWFEISIAAGLVIGPLLAWGDHAGNHDPR